MKLTIRIPIMIVIILTMSAGYTQKNDSSKAKKSSVANAEENKVTITNYYKKPPSFDDKSTMVLKGVSNGEFIEIRIQGTIKDFALVQLDIDAAGNLIESEILHEIEYLSNQIVLIHSSIPEGIPMEKVKWKSLSGKEYQSRISENGKDRQPIEFYLD